MLLEKLSHYGIKDVALNMFHCFLSNRVQYVSYNNTNSHYLPLETGVPRSLVLGPILSIIYINDISNISDKFKLINYADDTTLVSTFIFWKIKMKISIKNYVRYLNGSK